MSIVKLHTSLFKYLRQEVLKKKTIKDTIAFYKLVAIKYSQALLLEYKRLFLVFNKEYMAQKRQYDKQMKLKSDFSRALYLLQYIDKKFDKEGKSRQEVRQFWLDFTKSGDIRRDIFEQLTKELQ